MRRSGATAILLCALITGGAVRAWAVFNKPVFYHDESHSYQAATGHVGEAAHVTYDREPPYGQWAEAREWKRLLRPERRFCFVTISRDALAYDVHPPAYYWLLHLACLAAGTHLWTGVLLNSLIDGLTLFALYRFVRFVTADDVAAATAAFAWALSAAAIQVAVVEARQYSLLALVAVLFTHRLGVFVSTPGRVHPSTAFALFLLTAAGALTHHHFAILVAGAIGAAPAAKLAAGWRRVAAAVVTIAMAYGVIVLIHPVFYGTGFKHLSDAKLPDAGAFGARVRQTAEALAHLVLERRYGAELPVRVTGLLACVAPGVLVLAWYRAARGTQPPGNGRPARYALALGAWVMTVTVALYLAGITPAHAMSYRYLATAWPFVAVGVGLCVRTREGATVASAGGTPHTPAGAWVTCAVALVVGAQASFLQWHHLDWHERAAEADRLVRNADHVIIDNVGRGHWPRAVWRVREDARVIIATPNDLLRRPAPWRKEIAPGTVYISPMRSAEAPREKMLQSLRKDRPVEAVGHLFGIGEVYVVR